MQGFKTSALLLIVIAGLGARIACAQDASDVAVSVAPPELPEYEQPPIPGDGYVWTPGYWAWSDDDQDYYWVPGEWVAAPVVGYLWTPGYWFADSGVFVWYPGYWGPHVGFYGGVNYGHGYGGRGYQGGYWQGSHLFYNRAANNLGSAPLTNVYNSPIVSYTATRSSFNGGPGGVQLQPSPAELAAARESHLAASVAQRQHEDSARATPALHAGTNRGLPSPGAPPRVAPGTPPGGSRSASPEGAPGAPPGGSRSASPEGAPGAPPAMRRPQPVTPPAPAAQRPPPAPAHPSAPRPKDEHDHRT